MQMPQLVRVSYDIDCSDLAVLDSQRGGLKFAVGLQCNETGQSLDEAGANKFRGVLPEVRCQNSLTFMTASKPTTGSSDAGRLPPPSIAPDPYGLIGQNKFPQPIATPDSQ